MIATIVLCTLTFNAASWPGTDIRQEIVIVRSASQCHQLATTKSNSARGSTEDYERPRQDHLLNRYCGPDLKDCRDMRNK